MLRQRLQPALDWLSRVIHEPRSELTRWQRAARYAYDLGRFGARQLREDRASQMAAALSFRTLFGLIPVLVVATVLARTWMGADRFGELVTRLLGFLSVYEIKPGNTVAGEAVNFGSWLEGLIEQAPNINLTAIGSVGLIVLVYSAIGLMVTIENAFNTICRAPEGRSWLRRVPVYWFVLTFGPVMAGLAMYVDGAFRGMFTFVVVDGGNEVVGAAQFAWLAQTAGLIWSFLLVWLLMFAVYSLIPSTSVNKRAALIGAFVAAVLLEVGKRAMGAYLGNAVSISQLYGSLGLIPLFMFWVYIMWLVILFGLEVAAALHMLGGRRLRELERKKQRPSGLVEPAVVVGVMEVIGSTFAEGKPCPVRHIGDRLGLTETTVDLILTRLRDAGFIHRLAQEGAVTLAMPPEQIHADRVLEIGFELAHDARERPMPLLTRLRDAQLALAGETSLAALLGTSGPEHGDRPATDSTLSP